MDTTNSAHWFPMRVTYRREMSVKQSLDQLGIENFIPMRYQLVENRYARRYMLVPAIHNLIFVHAPQRTITGLKNTRRELLPLRYMKRQSYLDAQPVGEILRVPDDEMQNFMRVASQTDDRVIFLDDVSVRNHIGRRVRVAQGEFAGVEGVVRRIKKNKHVVVQIDGVAAVAITFVPSKFLMYVD